MNCNIQFLKHVKLGIVKELKDIVATIYKELTLKITFNNIVGIYPTTLTP